MPNPSIYEKKISYLARPLESILLVLTKGDTFSQLSVAIESMS